MTSRDDRPSRARDPCDGDLSILYLLCAFGHVAPKQDTEVIMPTTIAAPKTKTAPAVQEDFLPLEGTDYVEFYVGNAKQAAHYYMSAFGFQALAYAGPETGVKDRASYAVRQNKLTFVLTTPIRKDNSIADHIYQHGDGVRNLSLRVPDAAKAWEETTKRGAKSFMEPQRLK